jgi:hypothetical protein
VGVYGLQQDLSSVRLPLSNNAVATTAPLLLAIFYTPNPDVRPKSKALCVLNLDVIYVEFISSYLV